MAAKDSAWPDDALSLRDALQRLCPEECSKYKEARYKTVGRRLHSFQTSFGPIVVSERGGSSEGLKIARAAMLSAFRQKLRDFCFLVGKKLQPDDVGAKCLFDMSLLGLRDLSLELPDSTIKIDRETWAYDVRVFLDHEKALQFRDSVDPVRSSMSLHERIAKACVEQSHVTPYDGDRKRFIAAVIEKNGDLAGCEKKIRDRIKKYIDQKFRGRRRTDFKFTPDYHRNGKRGRPLVSGLKLEETPIKKRRTKKPQKDKGGKKASRRKPSGVRLSLTPQNAKGSDISE